MTWQLTSLLAALLLVAFSAFLVVCETVLTRLSVLRALHLGEAAERGGEQLLWLIEHSARAVNVVLLLTVSARVSAATLLAIVAYDAGGTALAAAAVLLVLVSFMFAEVAPRTYTLQRLELVGLRVAPVLLRLTRLLHPLVRVLVAVGGGLAPRSGAGPYASEEEVRRLAPAEEEQEIELEAEERAMIHSIFELSDTACREIMVPRPDMVTVSVDDPFTLVVETAIARGYSRIPVWRDSRDNIVGLVYTKDLLERLYTQPDPGEWADLLRLPTFVPESKRIDDLMRDLQKQKVHLAIVVDEHGVVVGLVTIEDILEEIVGEIVDEFDHEEPPVVRLDARRLRVSARVTVHDLNELLDEDLPEEEGWDTVGGLLIGMLGRVPEPGEAVQVDGVTLVAERVQGRRVSKVLVTVSSPDDGADGTPGVKDLA